MSLANIKKGDTVILHMFTGIAVGVKEVVAADKATITVETAKGKTKFSRKTSKQIEPEVSNERYANYLTEDDGSFVPRTPAKKAAKPKTKVKTKVEDEDEEDDEEEVKPAKKSKAKAAEKPAKKTKAKTKAKPVEEEDFDEDEFEEEE